MQTHTIIKFLFSLQIALQHLTSFKAILCLKRNPAIDRASLNADHLLPAVLGLKVGNSLRALLPRVPDNGVVDVISDDVETRLVVDEDRSGVLLEAFVDTVDLAFEAEFVAWGVVFGGVEDFVDVSETCEAGDLDFGDVLETISAFSPPQQGDSILQEWRSRCASASGSRRACYPRCAR